MKNPFKNLFNKKSSRPVKDRKKKNRRVLESEKIEMRKLYKDGITITQIAKKLSRPNSVVSSYVNRPTKKNGKDYVMSLSDRKKARAKYKANRVGILRRNHEKNTPKYHSGCPVCFDVEVPEGMTLDILIDQWVLKQQKLNLNDIFYAKKHSKEKTEEELPIEMVITQHDHEVETIQSFQPTNRIEPKEKEIRFCAFCGHFIKTCVCK